MEDERGPAEGLQALSDQLIPTRGSQPHNADRERTETSREIEIKGTVNPDLRDEAIGNTSEDSPQESSSWRFPKISNPFSSHPTTLLEDKESNKPSTSGEDKRRKKLKKDLEWEKSKVDRLNLDVERLTKQVNGLKKNNSVLKNDNKNKLTDLGDKWSRRYAELFETNKKTNTDLKNARNEYERLWNEYIKLKRSKEDLELELSDERKHVGELKQNIKDQEQVVTKAHSTAISLLARDVSTDLPDDEIKRQLHFIFQESVYGWCVETKVSELADPEKIKSLLESKGIMRSSNLPEHLQFDVGDSKIGPVISLQAALGHELCQAFLNNPFFLGPVQMNAALSGLKPEATVGWRIQTCDFLERTTHPSKVRDFCTAQAKSFAQTYEKLMIPLNETDTEELIGLFVSFGNLALKLWKRKANIKVESLGDHALNDFEVMYGKTEAHSSVGLLAGDHSLDGRPICVVVRPRIVSQPITERGGTAKGIVWSAASVWVSKKDPPRHEKHENPAGDSQRFESEQWHYV